MWEPFLWVAGEATPFHQTGVCRVCSIEKVVFTGDPFPPFLPNAAIPPPP